MFTFFAVRYKPTGQLFPAVQQSSHFDMEEPAKWEPKLTQYRTPRLFATERIAKAWLTSYVKGAVETKYRGEGLEMETYLRTNKETARNKADFEIVECTLTIKEPSLAP